ncbi:MAG: thioredoxin family protein [Planctomycetota bacterium]
MPPLESVMRPLGTLMPAFDLPNQNGGGRVDSRTLAGRPVLVMFLCNHCPYVKHIREALAALGHDLKGKPIHVVAISSNDPVAYPDDAPERMTDEARKAGYTFPYCFDATQEVAKAFDAACTPDFFLYDAQHRLAYRGRLDGSRPRSAEPVTASELRAAIDAVLAGRAADAQQHPSIGCSIKWRS